MRPANPSTPPPMPDLPTTLQPLPRTSIPWVIAVVVSMAALAFGIYGYYDHYEHGFIVSAMRDPGRGGAAWGMSIIFDVFFIGVAFAGIAVAAMSRLLHIKTLEPVTRIAQVMTIASVLAAAGCVLSDLGRPIDGLLKLPRYANPRSPFYGTFTLVVSGYMLCSIVFLFLTGRPDAAAAGQRTSGPLRWFHRLWGAGWNDTESQHVRHRRVTFALALGIVPLLVIAPSTLGFIFGIQSGRPGWYSALQAPSFVVMAGLSGTGVLILVAAALRRMFRLHDRIPDTTLRALGNLLWVLAAIYGYFLIVEQLTATYAAPEAERHVQDAITRGPFASLHWTMVGGLALAFAIPFALYLRRRTSVSLVVIAALGSLVAAILKRYLLVIPSQTHGALLPTEAPIGYDPTWAEYAIVLGLFGLVALVLLVFARVFPLVPTPTPARTAHRPPLDLLRVTLTLLTVLVAITLIVVGLADSFRMFSGAEIDPRIPYSPIIFAMGVVLLFASAVVYELVPEANRR